MSDADRDGQPLEHVARAALPWRTDPPLTECGKPHDGRPVLTRDEFVAKVRRLGRQRAAMSTCMTCWGAAERRTNWGQDPVAVMRRECGDWAHTDSRLRDELLALAALADAHRDEFEQLLTGLGDMVRLDERRRRRTRRA